jgi:hypothetical protein
MGWVANATPRPLYPRRRPGTHCVGGWVEPGPVWKVAENLVPNGVIPTELSLPTIYMYIYVHIYVCVCMYVCVYICIYIYIYTYIHTYIHTHINALMYIQKPKEFRYYVTVDFLLYFYFRLRHNHQHFRAK